MPSEYIGKLYNRLLAKFIKYYEDENEEFNKKVKEKKNLWSKLRSGKIDWKNIGEQKVYMLKENLTLLVLIMRQ